MVLKKQTVWLLTMLSLVIVLSVYYITSPQPGNEFSSVAIDEQKEQAENEDIQESSSMSDVEVSVDELSDQSDVTSGISSDDLFTTLRMTIDEQRARKKEHLQSVVASTNVNAEERSEALDEIEKLNETATKEDILETLLRSNQNYLDALVQAKENEIKVTVKAKERSEKFANEIIQMVRDQFGEKTVAVEFQPTE